VAPRQAEAAEAAEPVSAVELAGIVRQLGNPRFLAQDLVQGLVRHLGTLVTTMPDFVDYVAREYLDEESPFDFTVDSIIETLAASTTGKKPAITKADVQAGDKNAAGVYASTMLEQRTGRYVAAMRNLLEAFKEHGQEAYSELADQVYKKRGMLQALGTEVAAWKVIDGRPFGETDFRLVALDAEGKVIPGSVAAWECTSEEYDRWLQDCSFSTTGKDSGRKVRQFFRQAIDDSGGSVYFTMPEGGRAIVTYVVAPYSQRIADEAYIATHAQSGLQAFLDSMPAADRAAFAIPLGPHLLLDVLCENAEKLNGKMNMIKISDISPNHVMFDANGELRIERGGGSPLHGQGAKLHGTVLRQGFDVSWDAARRVVVVTFTYRDEGGTTHAVVTDFATFSSALSHDALVNRAMTAFGTMQGNIWRFFP
ncbi:MAG: hypothetical protein Q6373_015445, partial [Candidatus Sigynarchaeota archaeon]